jgi:phosphoglycolate phosphatase
MFQLIVFDLDGTLVDSRRDLADAANALLAERGAAALPEEAIGRMVGEGAATLVSRALAAAGLPDDPAALARFLELYDERLLRHTRPYRGIPEALESLATRATLAVLTNKPLDATRRVLDGLDLARFFDERVLGGDGPLPRKPNPDGLLHLVRAAGVERSAAVLVGDSMIDVRTAARASTALCLARYGFGSEDIPEEELQHIARVARTPGDLLVSL